MYFYYTVNHIGGVIVSVFDHSEVACELKPRSGQTKRYQINICCFSSKNVALRSKDLLTWNRGEIKRSDMSTFGVLFQ
jgi:hypothetical protein